MTLPIEFSAVTASAQDTAQSRTEPSPDSSFSAVLQASSATYTVDLNAIFERAAEEYGLDANLLKAIGKIESAYQTDAVSAAGAMGIMQLMPDTAKYLGVTDPFDPEQNIFGGAKLLAEHLEQYGGNLELALAAYNCGVGTVAKYGGELPPFTVNYIKVINEVLQGDLNAPIIEINPSSGSSSSAGGESLSRPVSGKDSLLNSVGMMLMFKMLERMSDSDDDENKII